MSSLPTVLRRQLEGAVLDARTIAEKGARKALEALAVHEPDPYRHMDEAQRILRRRLRAQARQLGDGESQTRRGAYEIGRLVEKLAYDQWHRLLFARFLLENNLLMSPEHGVSVTLEDCEELAPSLGRTDAWSVAVLFASKELPEIFRAGDPAGALEVPVEDRKALVALVTGLSSKVFSASDSLGWCYQYWQSERKDAINEAGVRVGAEELAPVTQLFTEDYMVQFLLHNTIGAWWAAKVLAATPALATSAVGEEELRLACAIEGTDWGYLRFVRDEASGWVPAGGEHKGWPKRAKELRLLDPCMGSGHFLVFALPILAGLRMKEENLSLRDATDAALRDNLFGLELDPRCTQIAAFNLAFSAWRSAGFRTLSQINVACSGLGINAEEKDWSQLAGSDERLKGAMKHLYALFSDAPVLGSLIDPKRVGRDDLLIANFAEVRPLLERALREEQGDDKAEELAVTARGILDAAAILAGEFALVVTNVPYLGKSKQDALLRDYCEAHHPLANADLATCFLERCLDLCATQSTAALVIPQNWLFLKTYQDFRRSLLRSASFGIVSTLGAKAFQTPMWDFNVQLLVADNVAPEISGSFIHVDVAAELDAGAKSEALKLRPLVRVNQVSQLENATARIVLGEMSDAEPLGRHATSYQGIKTGDDGRLRGLFWERPTIGHPWMPLQGTVSQTELYGGRASTVRYGGGGEGLARNQGQGAWRKAGVVVSQMASLPATLYSGDAFDSNVAPIVVRDPAMLPALWAFCESPEFRMLVRQLDQKVAVANGTFGVVPFDLAHWQRVAKEKYPKGLPKPASNDPTQWLFDGHPRRAAWPLQVAVARLLGFQWPRQTGTGFFDCPPLRSDGLEALADDDGIVCLAATKGEGAAAERLREVLARSWGTEWNAATLERLLAEANYAGATLDDWLRNGFFEQHCRLFHDRPFIWQIWDGNKSGFSALVNYHRLNFAGLEKLTYAYLGDWIRRQQASVDAGESGSDSRLEAAKALQARLKLILEGEPPFDLFVRWKAISRQAIGWHPDINDGVRLNIRPFMAADIVGGKKGAGILRAKPNIKWEKDRGKEPEREKKDFPWFWGWDEVKEDFGGAGREPDGNRWNSCHYSNEFKKKARESGKSQ